jgi:LmbE family N-acetylglucosaminyl deacetylase
MIRKTHTLMVVHAHPDDEASSTGGLLRFAAGQGHTTSPSKVLIFCSNFDPP